MGEVGKADERSYSKSRRLKFDIDRDAGTGKRITRFVTFHGTKREAYDELARLITSVNSSNFVETNKLTVAAYLHSWIAIAESVSLSPKTAERYRQLIDRQIIPHIGALGLQKLRASNIAAWHGTLLRGGRYDGTCLSARTVVHAHRVLHKALADAVVRELLLKNPASVISPPKIETSEMAILSGPEVKLVLDALRGTEIYPHVVVLLSTGIRRGELMAIQWGDLNLDAGKLRIERAIEVTKAKGLRIKSPKTRHGRRIIALPAFAIEVLRHLRKTHLEIRLKLGIGKLLPQHYVFGDLEGSPCHPDWITYHWKHCVETRSLPRVTQR